MQRKMLVLAVALLALSVTKQNVRAQSETSETPRFELGGQFTILVLKDFDVFLVGTGRTNPAFKGTEPGVGGRFTFNINRNVALEAETNFFPRNRNTPERESDVTIDGQFLGSGFLYNTGGGKDQVLFGARIGTRFRRFGVFGKARPGFMRYGAYNIR